jgi:excisionase family DNA binding protein
LWTFIMSRFDETRSSAGRASPARVGSSAKPTPSALLTVSEVAAQLRVSRRTVERLVARGELPFIALPLRRGGLRFCRGEIERFLEQRHRAPLE